MIVGDGIRFRAMARHEPFKELRLVLAIALRKTLERPF